MRVLLYTEGEKIIGKSGLGKAIKHQMKALELAGVEYTTDPKDTDFDTHTLMSDMEANTYEYLRLGKEKLLELELKFNNTEKLRNYVKEHLEIDHSTMEFPLCP